MRVYLRFSGIQGLSPLSRTRLDDEHDQPHIRSPFWDGCTNIPLAAGRAQEDGAILSSGSCAP